MSSAARVLAVFCYDISLNRARTRVAALLEADAMRVQESVFEGWMSRARAEALAARAARLLGPDDTLRLYLISQNAALKTRVYGLAPVVEAHDFFLL